MDEDQGKATQGAPCVLNATGNLKYVPTVRCVGAYYPWPNVPIEVRVYRPIICQECGHRVLSRHIPRHCPNPLCPSNGTDD